MLAHSLGADGALWPVDGGLRAQTAALFREEVLRRGDYDYAVHALAAFALSPALEDSKVQCSAPGQATGSWLCAPAALLAVLLLCRGGVRGGGSGDELEIARQVSKFVKCSSRAVVHVLSQEAQDQAGKSALSHRAGVWFVERLVQECQVCPCLYHLLSGCGGACGGFPVVCACVRVFPSAAGACVWSTA